MIPRDASLVEVRAASPDDLSTLADLEADAFGQDAWAQATLAGALQSEGRRAVVATDDAQPVGYAVSRSAGDIVDLERVVVRPDARRRGVASVLLDDLVAQADGADRMLVEVSALNRGAVAFYAARGFAQIDVRPRYYRDGSDALVMRRSLTRGCGGGRP